MSSGGVSAHSGQPSVTAASADGSDGSTSISTSTSTSTSTSSISSTSTSSINGAPAMDAGHVPQQVGGGDGGINSSSSSNSSNCNSNNSKNKKANRVGAGQSIDAVRASWSRCLFFMQAKQRFCNIARSAGSDFCGNHRAEGDPVPQRVQARAAVDGASGGAAAAAAVSVSVSVERIPCPIDPSHTVYRHDLASHIRSCNVTKRDALMRTQPFYRENCNVGGGDRDIHSPNADADAVDTSAGGSGVAYVDAEALLQKVQRCYDSFAHSKSDGMLWRADGGSSSNSDINSSGASVREGPGVRNNTNNNTYVPGPECASIAARILSAVNGEASTFGKVRHARQDIELVHRMLETGLIRNEVYTQECVSVAAASATAAAAVLGTAAAVGTVGGGMLSDWIRGSHTAGATGLSAGSMDRHSVLDASFREKSIAVIELGAGRGMLGLSVMCALTTRDGVSNSQHKASSFTATTSPMLGGDDDGAPKSRAAVAEEEKGEDLSSSNGYSCRAPQLILVERNGLRNKADRVLRDRHYTFARVRLDLRHCVLSRLPGVDNRLSSNIVTCARTKKLDAAVDANASDAAALDADIRSASASSSNTTAAASGACCCDVVLVAKHLCGVATDYSLLSVKSFSTRDHVSNDTGRGGNSEHVNHSFRGAAIATCCHHACRWRDYAGRAWLEQAHAFTEAEFDVMKQWSGWAHTLRVGRRDNEAPLSKRLKSEEGKQAFTGDAIDTNDEDGEEEEEAGQQQHAVPAMSSSTPRPSGLSYADMARIGKMVKRVIDQGRVEYLRALQLGGISSGSGDKNGGDCPQYTWRQVQYCDPSLSPECFAIIGGAALLAV